jgi:hypothetical protein
MIRRAPDLLDRFSAARRASTMRMCAAAGVDTTPLFVGLDGNVCQCPHWGFVRKGVLPLLHSFWVVLELPLALALRALGA